MEIKPTRSELIALKRRIKMAETGYAILKKKRDGLILSFFEILKQSKSARKELNEIYREAVSKMNICRMLESDIKIKSFGLAISNAPEVEISTKNIMGIIVPEVSSSTKTQKEIFERGYGAMSSSFAIDEAAGSYEKVVEKVIKVAEVELSMKKLLEEIEKTKRRVNALEFEIIPKMRKAKDFITLRLEEMERETTFRTKKIKQKNQKKKLIENKAG